MIRRCAPAVLFSLFLLGGIVAIAVTSARADEPPAVTVTVTRTVMSSYRGRSASVWASDSRHLKRQLQASHVMTHRLIVHKWQPTVMYALRLASAVSGVPLVELAPVAHCESTYNPFARNGKYKGIFQLGWSPFGFSPYDPVANALSAALTVRHDGSWRQWECKP